MALNEKYTFPPTNILVLKEKQKVSIPQPLKYEVHYNIT